MKRILIVSGLVAVLLIILGFSLAYNLNYSDGFRSGTVAKLSHKGMIFKTYEGQLLSGGLVAGGEGDVASNLWDFSVERGEKQVLADLEKAVDERYPVKLRYKEKYYKFFWRGDTKYFVYQVEKTGAKP
ncbi:MAG: 6-phosphogluconate dehydrogenase [Bacteroidetes bacterium]|nr:6-phosphogluconate dehydrogenase [Bacteroidota bacterium]